MGVPLLPTQPLPSDNRFQSPLIPGSLLRVARRSGGRGQLPAHHHSVGLQDPLTCLFRSSVIRWIWIFFLPIFSGDPQCQEREGTAGWRVSAHLTLCSWTVLDQRSVHGLQDTLCTASWVGKVTRRLSAVATRSPVPWAHQWGSQPSSSGTLARFTAPLWEAASIWAPSTNRGNGGDLRRWHATAKHKLEFTQAQDSAKGFTHTSLLPSGFRSDRIQSVSSLTSKGLGLKRMPQALLSSQSSPRAETLWASWLPHWPRMEVPGWSLVQRIGRVNTCQECEQLTWGTCYQNASVSGPLAQEHNSAGQSSGPHTWLGALEPGAPE